MRIFEIASAEEQLALWKLISDNIWTAISQQAEAERRQRAEKAAQRKLKPKIGGKRGGRKSLPPPPHITPPPPPKKPPPPQAKIEVGKQAAQQMGLTAKWEASVQSIKNYLPAWSEAYDNSVGDFTKTKRYVKGLIKTLGNESWMKEYGNTTTMLAVKDYVLNRDYVANELLKRKKYLGSGGFTDPNNTDLKEKWDDYILKLKLYDTGFSDLYTRYLENDNYEVIEVNK